MTTTTQSYQRRKKRALSPHQKQIRFFVCASITVSALLTAALFWLFNRPGLVGH